MKYNQRSQVHFRHNPRPCLEGRGVCPCAPAPPMTGRPYDDHSRRAHPWLLPLLVMKLETYFGSAKEAQVFRFGPRRTRAPIPLVKISCGGQGAGNRCRGPNLPAGILEDRITLTTWSTLQPCAKNKALETMKWDLETFVGNLFRKPKCCLDCTLRFRFEPKNLSGELGWGKVWS